MDLVPQFNDFITEIRPTKAQRDDLRDGHRTLKKRLLADPKLAPIIVTVFLQGSYRRFTAVRPKDDQRADVDLVVVTNLDEAQYTPRQAMALFVPFLNEHYKGKWRAQGRSYGIELSYVDLDLVITSAPGAVEQSVLKSLRSTEDVGEDEESLLKSWNDAWLFEGRDQNVKTKPLRIPDRDTNRWEDTHPLEQIRWTQEKNKNTNRLYVNAVKALKWWRRLNPEPKHPRGYPVEHLIGDCCPDGIRSVAEGVTLTLEQAVSRYAANAAAKTTPVLPDRGVPTHNVMHRVTGADFAAFYAKLKDAASLARRALNATTAKESGELWQHLFGDKFRPPPDDDRGSKSKGGFTERAAPTVVPSRGERWG